MAAVKIDNIIATVEKRGRHPDILLPLKEMGVSIKGEQGFITSEGRFVDRGKAFEIAKKAGQVKEEDYWSLISEDLW